ncbi:hypothetical protein C5167_013295 [Papaver somniferum]|uniref:Uncharacterized protein n=1 Tax=Papaver somniferum TaxID=3469 RepID=A0A4Y7J0U3_PAPSO|nr:hypothetical protein C5167_013295 [Papaver somniferum]
MKRLAGIDEYVEDQEEWVVLQFEFDRFLVKYSSKNKPEKENK